MRRRNPPACSPRRTGGPPPWPPAADIEACRQALVARRGLPPEASAREIADLRRAGAWWGGVDMTWAPDTEVMRRVWAWALATDAARRDGGEGGPGP